MRNIIVLIITFTFSSCASLKKLPKEHYYPFYYNFDSAFKNGTISFHLKNPLMCPINVKLVKDTTNLNLETLFGQVTLRELHDTIININYKNFKSKGKVKYVVRYGDYKREIKKNEIALPFPLGKEYKIIQGFNGGFSHYSTYSKYAIDFSLKIGDTITSVDDGYVVGLIEKYKEFGTSKKWKKNDRSNYITIYHPHSGLYSQYVHLNYNGGIIELGDYVKKGQPIGISGMTGYTTIEHLHFNVKTPTDKYGLISTKYNFENQIKANKLKKSDVVKNYTQHGFIKHSY